MKKTILIIIFYLAVGQVSAQIRVNSDGNVGIGRNPSYKLDVNISGTNKASFSSWFNTYIDQSGLYGATSIYPDVDWYLQLGYWDHQIGNIFTYGIHTTNIWWDSDSTFKKNFKKIENTPVTLSNIKAFKYQFSDDYLKSLPQKEKLKYQQGTFGFKAQDVEKIYPELTQKDEITGNYSINYIGFIPILVDAYQKQQEVINSQNLKINQLEESIEQIKSRLNLSDSSSGNYEYRSSVSKSDALGNSLTASGSFLYQNAPNPFSNETNIKCFVDNEVKTALLLVYDVQGNLKKQIKDMPVGFNSIRIDGHELAPGTYIYSLICDGKEVASKKMILLN